jgi:hypothetical protein
MRILSRHLKFLLALVMFGAWTSLATGQEAKSQIKAEIERLQKSLKEKPVSIAGFPDINSMVAGSLSSSAEALDAGKLYLSLEKLLQAEDLLEGARVVADKTEAVKSGFPAFEAEWEKVSRSLKTLNDETRKKDWPSAPLALQALAEAAQGRSVPLLEGGRGFAISTKPSDGLFYVGQAQGEAVFARYASSLSLARSSAPFPLRSFLSELQKLQQKANAAFQPPRSVQLHDRFIALNSALKLAKELDSQKFYAGALYQYLEATRHFGMLDAPPLDEARQSALKADLAAAQKKLMSSRQDDSLAQLFLERSESQTVHADGSVPSADEWRSSRVILEQVLPAYFAARKPAFPLKQGSGKTVDITLVRWPYT